MAHRQCILIICYLRRIAAVLNLRWLIQWHQALHREILRFQIGIGLKSHIIESIGLDASFAEP